MTRNKAIVLGAILAVALLITGTSFWLGFRSQNTEQDSPTPTPEISPTIEPTPTDEPTPSDSPTPTRKPTPTKTPTPTSTSTPTSTPTSTATPTPTVQTFAVTGVTANYVGYTPETCSPDKTHAFSGDITVNMAGTVSYRWVKSEGPVGDTKTKVFSGPGTLPVEQDNWILNSPSYTGWDRIDILSPNSTSSNQANFTHTCP